MDINKFIGKAKEKGFDTVAALRLDRAEAAIAEWESHLQEGDFAGFLTTNPREILPQAVTVLVLAYPYRTYTGYPDKIGTVSGYYVASNRAFHAAGELAEYLRTQGASAVRSHKLPLKPLARAAGLGRYGRNGVIVRKGSHIVIAAILTDADIDLPPAAVPVPGCERCGRCEKACPAGCLADGRVQAYRCLRAYMTHNAENIPGDLRPLMGQRLLGCDECLNACPGLTFDPVPEQFARLFSWDALADPERYAENRTEIAQLIGTNNADAIHKSAGQR